MKRFTLFVISIVTLALASCSKPVPEHAPEEVVFETTKFMVSAEGGKVELVFVPTSAWTSSASESWLSHTPESGEASEESVVVTVTVNRNKGKKARTADILFSFETNDVNVSIIQEARRETEDGESSDEGGSSDNGGSGNTGGSGNAGGGNSSDDSDDLAAGAEDVSEGENIGMTK